MVTMKGTFLDRDVVYKSLPPALASFFHGLLFYPDDGIGSLKPQVTSEVHDVKTQKTKLFTKVHVF
jgi:hypothetical protein